MALRATWLAIVIGGACGTFAALVGQSPKRAPSIATPTTSSLPLRPIEQTPFPAPNTASATPGPSSTLGPSIPMESANVDGSARATPTASPAPSASGLPATSATSSVDTTPAPETKEALLHAEMHCDRKEAAACALAARGYETGSAGPTDPDKAAKYRRIALTLWIIQCDHSSAAACATLIDMYRDGRGVPQNAKTAEALLVRTRELCHYNDTPACHALPNP